MIELKKALHGTERVDDWIRLLNATTEEELDMIKTKNPGILEAIREVKHMSLKKELRALYEGHMKEVRDRNARDDYVRAEGRIEGRAEGKAEGKAQDILLLLEQKSTVPPQVKEAIFSQKDEAIMARWLLLAAGAENIEEFRRQAGL